MVKVLRLVFLVIIFDTVYYRITSALSVELATLAATCDRELSPHRRGRGGLYECLPGALEHVGGSAGKRRDIASAPGLNNLDFCGCFSALCPAGRLRGVAPNVHRAS